MLMPPMMNSRSSVSKQTNNMGTSYIVFFWRVTAGQLCATFSREFTAMPTEHSVEV